MASACSSSSCRATLILGGYSGDGGRATNAALSWLEGVAADPRGNLFIADTRNNHIRRVDTNGFITTLAGNGTSAYAGDGGPAASASLSSPNGEAVDASGNLFFADTANGLVREILLSGSPTLQLNTVSAADAGTYDVVAANSYGSVTSSVVTLTVQSTPPVILSTTRNAGATLTLTVSSATGTTSRILASTNLAPPAIWQPVFSNSTGGSWQFTDSSFSNHPIWFYRCSTP